MADIMFIIAAEEIAVDPFRRQCANRKRRDKLF